MGTVSKIVSGTGVLIALYLLFKNAEGASSVISSMGSAYAKGVATLQGNYKP